MGCEFSRAAAKAAGWWVWGICAWIGSGWCSGDGPWVKAPDGHSVIRRGTAGQGVNRQLPHMGDAGRGVNRQLPHMGNAGRGVMGWFEALAARLRRVRVACGDFERVLQFSLPHPPRLVPALVLRDRARYRPSIREPALAPARYGALAHA